MNNRRTHQRERSTSAEATVEASLLRARRAFHRFLVRRLGSVDAADDVFQEFSIRALAKSSSVKKDESTISWLYRVLRSTLVDYLRNARREKRLEAAFAADSAVGPGSEQPPWTDFEAELHAAICECLYQILPLLKSEYRDVLWRIDLRGEPRRVVATDLGISAGALTVRLHRARRFLRAELTRVCQTCPEHGFQSCRCDRKQVASDVRQLRGRVRRAAGLD